MGKWKIYTPEGVQDILFEECFLKRNLEETIRKMFRSCGYYEIETPAIEFYDAFSADGDMTPQEMMFKFFDEQGRILVLRPDMTIPVARVAATKYKGVQYPLKISYIGNAFRYNEMGGGKQKEFTQAGVEIIGISNPEADAEVIATAIKAMEAAGIRDFQIDIGQVEFFKGLMKEAGLLAQDVEQMRIQIDRKDFLGIEELLAGHSDIPEALKELILKLPSLFGTIDVIDTAESIAVNKRSLDALANLRSVLEIIEDYGLSSYVSIDLGMVQSLNYYTGIIFRGFTYGLGFPLLSGGRYDGLIEKFGMKCPATGFSIGINMAMTALERQKADVEKPGVETLVCYMEDGRKTAFKICSMLRKQDTTVEMDISLRGIDKAVEYAKSKGIGGIIRVMDNEVIELYNIKTGEVAKTSLSKLAGRYQTDSMSGL